MELHNSEELSEMLKEAHVGFEKNGGMPDIVSRIIAQASH